jgi:hypothetical protein
MHIQYGTVNCEIESSAISLFIATGYGLDDQGVGVRVPVGARIFTFHLVQTGSWDRPASYPMGTGSSFVGGKAAGA